MSPAVPLPRVRFTVRRMMVAVAVVAVHSWVGRLYWQSRAYIDLSNYYETRLDLPAPKGVSEKAWYDQQQRDLDRMIKYRRLGFTPWLAPDPPAPE